MLSLVWSYRIPFCRHHGQPPACLIGCRSEIVSWLKSYSELGNTVGMVIAYQKSDNPANTINQVPTIPY